ncbi:hypothetical protein FF011L_03860 [Roseimaritima multifibrata]|uniref:Uncharacterized protein n=1 Tax=Roseimaritima multifibrata TaxID=1930274 RepID=A0A517M9U3_9BACT|nr:hypothetical protein FF011L_03860 [Roseimaritima multifibrata]
MQKNWPASHFAFLIFHYSILILLGSPTASGIARHESVAALPWPGENHSTVHARACKDEAARQEIWPTKE